MNKNKSIKNNDEQIYELDKCIVDETLKKIQYQIEINELQKKVLESEKRTMEYANRKYYVLNKNNKNNIKSLTIANKHKFDEIIKKKEISKNVNRFTRSNSNSNSNIDVDDVDEKDIIKSSPRTPPPLNKRKFEDIISHTKDHEPNFFKQTKPRLAKYQELSDDDLFVDKNEESEYEKDNSETEDENGTKEDCIVVENK
jgi:hypothetical protein